MTHYGMVIDTTRCIGCHTCAVACKMANNLPVDMWWNRIFTIGGDAMDTADAPNGLKSASMSFLPVNCQHCENPPCVKVCPVGATYKNTDNGLVIQDVEKCIGCRYCMNACPYTGVRQFNWKDPEYYTDFALGDSDIPEHTRGVVEKCTFCAHRLARGEQPACMELCPSRCRWFGDLDDPDSEVSQLIANRSHTQLLSEEGTHPSVYYLV